MDNLEERINNIETDLAFIKEILIELTSGTKEAFIELYSQIDTEFNNIKSSLGMNQEPMAITEIKRR